jgi:O-succinylbenzoate synthase
MDAPVELASRRYRLPFRVPLRTAHGVWTEREGIVLRVVGEGGRVGYGEIAPIHGFGGVALEEVVPMLSRLGPTPSAEELLRIADEVPGLRMALIEAGVDGGGLPDLARDHVMVSALLPAGRAALGVLRERLELGFRVAKWKVGVEPIADELALLDDLLALLPSGARLRLDANGAWDRRHAERWLEAASERPIEYVEQPIEPGRRGAEDLLLGLAGDYPVPVALDESIADDGDIEAWLGRGWPGVYVVKPTLLSDPRRTIEGLAKARAAVVFSSALETAVGFKRGLRWAFAWRGEARAVGFGVGTLFSGPAGDVPPLAPFWRWAEVERMNPEATWSALS